MGAQFAIGGLFLIHIALVGFILAATGMAPFLELAGRRRGGDPSCLRYARGLSRAILYLYSLGATWAVLAVFLLAGLYGRLIGTLLNELLLPLTIAFASFFVGIPLMLLYAYTWDRVSPRVHLAIGFAFAAVQYVFLFTIVELDSYVLTPGTAVSAVGRCLLAQLSLAVAPLRRSQPLLGTSSLGWACRLARAEGNIGCRDHLPALGCPNNVRHRLGLLDGPADHRFSTRRDGQDQLTPGL